MRGQRAAILIRIAFLSVLSLSSVAQSRGADCNAPADSAVRLIGLPGHPFGTVSSLDGCWIFVSLTSPIRWANGVAVLQRNGNGDIRLQKILALDGNPFGMVLTHDGKLLIVADADYIVFLDVQKLISAQGNPIAGFLSQPDAASVYPNVTHDDKYLFVSDENISSIRVIDLERARANGFDDRAIVGRIPTGIAPVAISFSPDEKLLYATSEIAAKEWAWPAKCKVEDEDTATAKIDWPEGAILVVDVEKAKTDPSNSLRARVPVGCSPVRLAVAADGASIWTTLRNSDAVAAFDTAKLLADPEHARIGWVPVGRSPNALTITRDGKYVIISIGDRFGSDANRPQTLTVIDPKKAAQGAAAVVGSIQAGVFPRHFGLSADGKTIFLANAVSNTLQVIDADRLPLTPTTSTQRPQQ